MSDRFEAHGTGLPGVIELRRRRIGDDRGYLERLFCRRELSAFGWPGDVQQANRTLTRARGTIRGLHYQCTPMVECKLVTCLAGRVQDVALDLRDGSPTFGRHVTCILDGEIGNALLIPEGFAHGFQTLTEDCEMLYFHSEFHAPDTEGGIDALDPELAIDWPLPAVDRSSRDRALPPFAQARRPGVVFP